MTLNELLELIDLGIPLKIRKKRPLVSGAFEEGMYLGCPGKDIFFFLKTAQDEQLDIIAKNLSKQIPHTPPNDHVGNAACIRYIYGQFEKNGIFKSNKQEILENKANWETAEKFMDMLEDKFKQVDNCYGLSLVSEMRAHRRGDLAVINKDKSEAIKMEKLYRRSYKNAAKCNSLKHMFTPFYWCSKYFDELGNKEKSIKYAKKCLIEAYKYCPDNRHGYRTKIRTCIRIIQKFDSKKDVLKFAKKTHERI